MVARSPREAGQAKQPEPQHCEAPLETFHHLACRFQHGGGVLLRISNFGDKPKPSLPTPGDSIRWTLTLACIGAKLLGLVGSWGESPRARAGLQEWGKLKSPGDRMRSWKRCGVKDCVTHSFNKHSWSHGGAPDLGLTLGTKMNQAQPRPQKAYIPSQPPSGGSVRASPNRVSSGLWAGQVSCNGMGRKKTMQYGCRWWWLGSSVYLRGDIQGLC